jgi:hypothetical protein
MIPCNHFQGDTCTRQPEVFYKIFLMGYYNHAYMLILFYSWITSLDLTPLNGNLLTAALLAHREYNGNLMHFGQRIPPNPQISRCLSSLTIDDISNYKCVRRNRHLSFRGPIFLIDNIPDLISDDQMDEESETCSSFICKSGIIEYFNVLSYIQKTRNTFDRGKSYQEIEMNNEKAILIHSQETDIQVLVFKNPFNDQISVVIPGTKSLKNLFFDLAIRRMKISSDDPLYVHSGFYKSFRAVYDPTLKAIKELMREHKHIKGITIFGHSLGAAVGSLISRELNINSAVQKGFPINLYTIGCPPISSPSIPVDDLGSKVFHMYIPGDIVFALKNVIPNFLEHPGGSKFPLKKNKKLNDPSRHLAKSYRKLLEDYDSCPVEWDYDE